MENQAYYIALLKEDTRTLCVCDMEGNAKERRAAALNQVVHKLSVEYADDMCSDNFIPTRVFHYIPIWDPAYAAAKKTLTWHAQRLGPNVGQPCWHENSYSPELDPIEQEV